MKNSGVLVVAKEVSRQRLEQRWGSAQAVRDAIGSLAALNSEHLVRFLGADFHDVSGSGDVLLISEYMEGHDLEAYLRSKRADPHYPWVPPKPRMLSWALCIARALDYLHAQELVPDEKLVHENLRPSNLLLTGDVARVRMATSCILSPMEHSAEPGEKSLENCIYSAPEVMCHKLYTDKADIFAFAMIVWFICTGARPYAHLDNDGHHEPDEHILQRFAEGRMQRPSLKDVALRKDMKALIEQAWDADPACRPPAEEVRRRLEEAEAAGRAAQCCLIS